MSGQIQPRNTGAITSPGGPRSPMMITPQITPKEILGILRRHIWMIVILTMLFSVLFLGLWFAKKTCWPEYTAVSGIDVLPQGLTDPMEIGQPSINRDVQFQFRNTKAEMLKSPGTLEEFIKLDTIQDLAWYKQFHKSRWKRFSGPILSLFTKNGNGNENGEGHDEADQAKAVIRALKDLQKNLSIVAQRDATYIRVAMTCSGSKGKQECAEVVNRLIDMFYQQEDGRAKADFRARITQLNKQQGDLQKEITDLDRELDRFRRQAPIAQIANLGGNQFRDFLDEKLGNLETDVSRLEGEVKRFSSLLESARRRAEGEYDEVVRELIERDPVATTMRQRIALLEVQQAEMLARFGENHTRVMEIRNSLRQAREDLAYRQNEIGDIERKRIYIVTNDEVAASMEELTSRQEELRKSREEHAVLSGIRDQYDRTYVKREDRQQLLQSINTQIEKVKALIDDPELSKIKPMLRAIPPRERSAPNLLFYLSMGIFFGLALGVGLAFAIEMLNDLVRTPSDVMRHLHVPLLGMICHAEDDHDLEGIDLYHVVRQAPYSVTSECYRQLRTNLKLSGTVDTQKVLLVTSAGPGDGKTSVALNMTTTFVADDQKVLLIDANFRRPTTSLSQLREAENGTDSHPDFGLSNYLMGQCQEEQSIIRSSGIEDFDIVDAGPLPANPGELLGSDRMMKLLDYARTAYDYVVLDGPPLLVSDAKTLAAIADGTVLVFNAATTKRGAAQRALRELRAINANVIGTVLMGVKTMKGGYFEEMFRTYQKYQQVPVRPAV
ncbi:MAG: polysaccharide biosynthesis tyrosine autokinase [Sedimentisphaerales bacterium]|nr:polysaccharide biosynthesis tyrosine autokinase [Sedimentisphaerales bacterium]